MRRTSLDAVPVSSSCYACWRHDRAPVWVFVTTHADDGHGGLYHATGGSSMPDFVRCLAVPTRPLTHGFFQFFESVLTEPIHEALRNRSVACFMMVSGGLVNYPGSRSALLKAAVE